MRRYAFLFRQNGIFLTLCSKGFTIENNTTDSIYAFLVANPERAGRFGNAMAAYLQKPEHSPRFITDFYDWASLGKAKVVHLGGGPGQFAIALAKKHANLSLVVQDMAFMMGSGEAGVPESVTHTSCRVTYIS